MTFLMYLAVCIIYIWLCEKVGVTDTSDTAAIVLAILTAGEVISLRCKR